MIATLKMTIEPRDAVPSDPAERVAWLERYGVLPETATVEISAPIADWTTAGATIASDGTIDFAERYSSSHWLPEPADRLRMFLRERILAWTREAGRVPAGNDGGLVRLAGVAADAMRERHAKRMAEDAAHHEAEQAAHKSAQVEREAQGARAKAAREVCESALRAYAAKYDDLARGACEGYPVTGAILARIAQDFADSVSVRDDVGAEHLHYQIDDTCWNGPDDKAAPRPDAFALLDAVQASAKGAELPGQIGRWEVSRIVRIDACPHRGQKHNVTAVLATLRTACGDREITFSLESLDCTHGEWEDE